MKDAELEDDELAKQARAEIKEARNKRIKAEQKRISRLFIDMPPDEMQIVKNLIRRVAFMQITLEDCEEDIKEYGTTEMFSQNVACSYMRERPIVRTFNIMIKNYTSTIKQLLDMLPKGNAKVEEDELMKFIKK